MFFASCGMSDDAVRENTARLSSFNKTLFVVDFFKGMDKDIEYEFSDKKISSFILGYGDSQLPNSINVPPVMTSAFAHEFLTD